MHGIASGAVRFGRASSRRFLELSLKSKESLGIRSLSGALRSFGRSTVDGRPTTG